VLLPGVKVTLTIAKTGDTQTWQYDQGLRGYLIETLAQTSNTDPLIPLFEGEQYANADAEGFAEGGRCGMGGGVGPKTAMWCAESYVNLIPTPAGGTHESACAKAYSAR